MRVKRIAAVLLAGAMAASMLTGCGINKDATAATFSDGREVKLGFVNFMCRYSQANQDDMFTGMMGPDVWDSDPYGSGSTFGDQIKSSTVEQVHEWYTLCKEENMKKYNVEITDDEKKAISEAASKFMSDNSKDTLDEMGATQEIVEQMLTFTTISTKMHDEIIKEADTNVSDAEANMRGYSVVEIARNGHTDESYNYVEYTDDEKAKIDKDAKEFATAVKSGKDLDTAAKDYEYKVEAKSYAADDESLAEELKKALDGLKEGEISDLVTTDESYYVVRIDKETDADATKTNKENIIKKRQDDKYSEVLAELQKDDGWAVKEKEIAKIKFFNHFTQVDPNATQATESVPATEAQ